MSGLRDEILAQSIVRRWNINEQCTSPPHGLPLRAPLTTTFPVQHNRSQSPRRGARCRRTQQRARQVADGEVLGAAAAWETLAVRQRRAQRAGCASRRVSGAHAGHWTQRSDLVALSGVSGESGAHGGVATGDEGEENYARLMRGLTRMSDRLCQYSWRVLVDYIA